MRMVDRATPHMMFSGDDVTADGGIISNFFHISGGNQFIKDVSNNSESLSF